MLWIGQDKNYMVWSRFPTSTKLRIWFGITRLLPKWQYFLSILCLHLWWSIIIIQSRNEWAGYRFSFNWNERRVILSRPIKILEIDFISPSLVWVIILVRENKTKWYYLCKLCVFHAKRNTVSIKSRGENTFKIKSRKQASVKLRPE